MSHWERCPECGQLGKIDDDQKQGRVSIICSECGHHYHKEIKKGDHVAIVVQVVEPDADYLGMIVSPMNVFEGETQPEDEEFYIGGSRILGKVVFTKESGWDFETEKNKVVKT